MTTTTNITGLVVAWDDDRSSPRPQLPVRCLEAELSGHVTVDPRLLDRASRNERVAREAQAARNRAAGRHR